MSGQATIHFDLREKVQGGLKPLSDTAGPYAYAARLARYIHDASTIRARTINEYGSSPSIDQIRVMMAKARDARAKVREMAARDMPDESEDPAFWGTPGLIRLAAERRALAEQHAARRALAMLTDGSSDGAPHSGSKSGSADAIAQSAASEVVPRQEVVTARQVITMTARAFGLTYADIVGQSRVRRIVSVRHMVAWILHRRGRLSLSQIGREMGGRDHSTAINSVRRFEETATPDHRAAALAIANWRNPAATCGEAEDVACAETVAETVAETGGEAGPGGDS